MPIKVLILPSRRLLELQADSITLGELVRKLVDMGVGDRILVLVNDKLAEDQGTLIRNGDNVIVVEEAPGG
jgi:molybdopterin converting factor small subunit